MAELIREREVALPSDRSPSRPVTSRIPSVDILRGLVMVVMAIDHSRDYLSNVPFPPEDIAHTYPTLFFTRWITHFCAPLFFFLAGTGAFLFKSKTGSTARVSRFLASRGLWLIVLEFTIIDYAWTFVPWHFGGVIWSLGCAMIILAALVWLPLAWILGIGMFVIAASDLTDALKLSDLSSLRSHLVPAALHPRGRCGHERD